MNIEETEKYFGTLYKACKALGLTIPNITSWKKRGYIPLLQQYRIAELTEGFLMPDEQDPKPRRKPMKNKRKGNRNISLANK